MNLRTDIANCLDNYYGSGTLLTRFLIVVFAAIFFTVFGYPGQAPMAATDYYKLVGRNIKATREERGLHVWMLAILSGLTPEIITAYENGTTPQTDKDINMIATALAVRPGSLRPPAP